MKIQHRAFWLVTQDNDVGIMLEHISNFECLACSVVRGEEEQKQKTKKRGGGGGDQL